MAYKVQKEVLEAGVKILFVEIRGLDGSDNTEWLQKRNQWISKLYEQYKDIDVHQDPILEGFNILHDRTGVKRRKNVPASENLIKQLVKHEGEVPYINKVVDIYNLISIESKLALGAHNIDHTEGNVTLRFTDGTERFQPLGQSEPIAIAPHEYSYIDDSNEVLCRLEIRQVQKTLVDESAQNVFYIVQGNEATSDELLKQTAQQIIDITTEYSGGKGKIIVPEVA